MRTDLLVGHILGICRLQNHPPHKPAIATKDRSCTTKHKVYDIQDILYVMESFRIAAAYLMIILLGSANATTVSVFPGSSIQAAIYTAKAGDVVEVHRGVYYEHVNVNKRITLKGIDMPTLDATASGSAITLKTDGIILKGFRTINSGQWPGDGSKEAGIKVLSNNNIIENNNASNNSNGIFIIGGNNNTITGNTADNNLGYGIMLSDSAENIILKNNFIRNYKQNVYDDGINRWDVDSVGNYYGNFNSLVEGCQDLGGNDTCEFGYPVPGGWSIDHYPSLQPF
ncbi:Periplasmic copper-binding protein (NosD) [uncultured archaeon]|nr:Periplasmic copper-binding protein (NosD) [uncultured archaeon]